MATIVTQQRPWYSGLAGFLLPLAAGAIERGRENDMRRKESALFAEYMKRMTPQETFPGFETSLPTGYDEAFPWQTAGQDTTGILKRFEDAVKPMTMPQTPSDPLAPLMELLGSKRFSMIGPDRGMALIQPYLERMKAEQDARNVRDFVNSFRQSGGFSRDPADIINDLFAGNVQGYVDKSVFGHGLGMVKHMNPHLKYEETDLGDRKQQNAFDPYTGTISRLGEYPVGMNPFQRGTLEDQRSNTARGWAEYYARLKGFGDYGNKDNYFLQQLKDGTLVKVNRRTGEITPTGYEGPQKAGQAGKLTDIERSVLNDALIERRKINAKLRGPNLFDDDRESLLAEKAYYDEEIARLQERDGMEPYEVDLEMINDTVNNPEQDLLTRMKSALRDSLGTGASQGLSSQNEATIEQMMEETGKSREEVIDFLKRTKKL